MEKEKIQLLAQLNKSMLDASEQLDEAIKKRDAKRVEQLKAYISESQKKFDSSMQNKQNVN